MAARCACTRRRSPTPAGRPPAGRSSSPPTRPTSPTRPAASAVIVALSGAGGGAAGGARRGRRSRAGACGRCGARRRRGRDRARRPTVSRRLPESATSRRDRSAHRGAEPDARLRSSRPGRRAALARRCLPRAAHAGDGAAGQRRVRRRATAPMPRCSPICATTPSAWPGWSTRCSRSSARARPGQRRGARAAALDELRARPSTSRRRVAVGRRRSGAPSSGDEATPCAGRSATSSRTASSTAAPGRRDRVG